MLPCLYSGCDSIVVLVAFVVVLCVAMIDN